MGVLDYFTRPLVALLNAEKPVKGIQLSDYERLKYELKPCDVILVAGRSRVSDVIRLVTQSPWTHAALYIGRLHDIEDPDLRKIVSHYYKGDPSDRLIIESQLGVNTLVRNLDIYQKEHLRICRPARLGMKESQQVVRYSVSRLGVDYDVRHIFDLMRFLFPWSIMPRRWRSTLFEHNAGQSTRTVCSTMIAEAFAFVQFPILPLVKLSGNDSIQLFRRNPKLCTPSDFDYSPYFKIIKYPFIDIQYHDEHNLLPWNGNAQLEEEESQFYMEAESQPRSEDVEEAISLAVANTDQPRGDENEIENLQKPEDLSADNDAKEENTQEQVVSEDATSKGNVSEGAVSKEKGSSPENKPQVH
ncbi:MAG: hypothetical protein JKY88_15145 [Pseudomonadales bacterium]|nr:hypothetical protein [Pseudomonadales bacterium]